jgi:hypothetical protein
MISSFAARLRKMLRSGLYGVGHTFGRHIRDIGMATSNCHFQVIIVIAQAHSVVCEHLGFAVLGVELFS